MSGAAPAPAYAVACGYYGYGNSGDEAILYVLLDQLGQMGLSRTYVLTEVPEAIDRLYAAQGAVGLRDWEIVGLTGVSHLLRGRPFRKLAIQARAQVFIYGGGSILRDDGMSWRNFFRMLDDIFVARICGVPVFFYALGVGPFRSWIGRRVIAAAARCARAITVRDEKSAGLLRGLGIPSDRIAVVTDPAFLLPAFDPQEAARQAGIDSFLARHPRTLFVYPTMAMAEPPLATDDALLHAMAAALSRLAAEDGWAVVFVPMEVLTEEDYRRGHRDDILTNRRIAAAMEPTCAVHLMEHALPPPAMRALTQLAGLNLTVRLHPMIYAASLGIPCVALNYDPKVAGNAQRFGLGQYVVDFERGWEERMVERVRHLAANLETERARQEAALPALRAGAAETFTRLTAMLSPSQARLADAPAGSD
jgi:polysaccharide pyruvyl transferase WcaK-like protein